MNFGAMGVFEHVTVGDDAIGVNKEAAAARELFAARVESFNRDGGWLNAANEFGKKIL